MQLRKSERKKAKIKLALQGSAGSGKTYSSLLLAQGLTNNNLAKVAVIDSENGSADLYAHLGNYNVLTLKPPFTPENYIKAIDVCEKAGMEVIIIDSISQSWEALLDYHSSLAGNSFTNWAKVTPRQNAFIDKILQADAHIIATMRTKQDYVLNQKDGKFIPEKVGLKAIQRNDLDYEFTLVFDVDIKHFAVASKDRTGLFMGKPEFTINITTGKKILEWCNTGNSIVEGKMSAKEMSDKINCALSVSELTKLFNDNPTFQEAFRPQFQTKKIQLELLTNPQNFSINGNSKHN
jgi:hypothetical protein